MRPIVLVMCLVAISMLLASSSEAEEAQGDEVEAVEESAAESSEEGEGAVEEANEETPSSEEGASEARGDTPDAPEELVRLGRVESVLIANEDPESAIEFGEEMSREGLDTARLRLLMGACYMQLRRYAEAIEQWQRAARDAGDEHDIELRALYNIARAHHAAGSFADAAAAYDRYVAYARAHEELTSFVDEAERLASRLRARAGQ